MIIDDEKLTEFEAIYNEFWRTHGVGGDFVKREFAEAFQAMLRQTRSQLKPNRSALLRMAGNIASGIATQYTTSRTENRQAIAEDSVDIARRILALVDGAKP